MLGDKIGSMKAKLLEKMMNPKSFLLSKVVQYENDYKSLGTLKAEYFDDITRVMQEFAEQTTTNVINRLKNGESVIIGEYVFSFKKTKS